MRIAIHQSHYLPWQAYFDKIARADLFVVLDDVQFTKNGWQNRNKIKTPQGGIYLTVPVRAHRGQRIADVAIDPNRDWARRHWRSLQMSYGRAPFFGWHREALEGLYTTEWPDLLSLNQALLLYCLRALEIATPVVRSSDLSVGGESTMRLIEICRAVGADSYLTGACALDAYLDASAMRAAGISVVVQDWEAPRYRQQYPRTGFVPDLSILDLLLNEGPHSLDILLGRGAPWVARRSAPSTVGAL
jgi:hypothetical protein